MYFHRSVAGSVYDQVNKSTSFYQILSKYAQSGLFQLAVTTLYFALMNQLHRGQAVSKVSNWL